MSPFVALDDVSHVYGGAGGTLAVDGLSIHVNRGEFAAVVGPSGCGKSTLMKLATGLQFPFKGKVQVAGSVVSKPVKIAGMAFRIVAMNLPFIIGRLASDPAHPVTLDSRFLTFMRVDDDYVMAQRPAEDTP